MKKVRIGWGSASWGDMNEPALELLKKGNLDYLGADYLSELTLSILQRWKSRDPKKGYIPDLLPHMKVELPYVREKGVKIVTNAGGANPQAGAEEVIKIAKSLGFTGLKFGICWGDDILPRIKEYRAKGIKFKNLDTGEEDIDRIADKVVAATCYVGADAIVDVLKGGADVVIAGRASDNALAVGPWMHEFGWKYEEPYWNKISAAVAVGHIIECGACCAGAMSSQWKSIKEPWKVADPIAEMDENAECIITKLEDAGGLVNVGTVKEHLVYEIHDPRNYLMPDAIPDFTTIKIEQAGENRVKVSNLTGKKRPDMLKVALGYEDGFIGEGHIWFPAPDAFEKAQWAEKWMRERIKLIDGQYDELRIDYLGVNTLGGSTVPFPPSYAREMYECGLRMVVKCKTEAEAERLKRIPSWLWTHGPIGSSFGAPFPVRPIISMWPTLIPRSEVPTYSEVKEVK